MARGETNSERLLRQLGEGGRVVGVPRAVWCRWAFLLLMPRTLLRVDQTNLARSRPC